MKGEKKPYKTYATAKAILFEPTKKAIAMSSTALEQINEDKIKSLLPQTDLLYIRSVLVTAGMNANDDVIPPQGVKRMADNFEDIDIATKSDILKRYKDLINGGYKNI